MKLYTFDPAPNRRVSPCSCNTRHLARYGPDRPRGRQLGEAYRAIARKPIPALVLDDNGIVLGDCHRPLRISVSRQTATRPDAGRTRRVLNWNRLSATFSPLLPMPFAADTPTTSIAHCQDQSMSLSFRSWSAWARCFHRRAGNHQRARRFVIAGDIFFCHIDLLAPLISQNGVPSSPPMNP